MGDRCPQFKFCFILFLHCELLNRLNELKEDSLEITLFDLINEVSCSLVSPELAFVFPCVTLGGGTGDLLTTTLFSLAKQTSQTRYSLFISGAREAFRDFLLLQALQKTSPQL